MKEARNKLSASLFRQTVETYRKKLEVVCNYDGEVTEEDGRRHRHGGPEDGDEGQKEEEEEGRRRSRTLRKKEEGRGQ